MTAANTRWTCCSTAGWCWELPTPCTKYLQWSAGGAPPRRRPRQMPSGGWSLRSWTISASWWRSTMPSRPTAARPTLPLAGPGAGTRAGTRARSFIGGPGHSGGASGSPGALQCWYFRWAAGWLAPARSCQARARRWWAQRPRWPVLFPWPDEPEGWVRGRVVRLSRATGFSHVVHYGPQSPLGAIALALLLSGTTVTVLRARLQRVSGRPVTAGPQAVLARAPRRQHIVYRDTIGYRIRYSD